MQDLNVTDHPTRDPFDPDPDESDWYVSLLRVPLGYELARTLNLTKYFTTDPITSKPFSVARRQYLGEAYEYRSRLRLDYACTSILPVPGGLPGDVARCRNKAEYRAVAHQGYPIDGTWRACLLCACEDPETDYVSTIDGQPAWV